MFRPIAAGLPVLIAGCATIDGTTQSSSAPGAATPSGPSRPAFVAADLEGKAAADLDAMLGAPALTRVEGEGEFRRYAFADCALLIILYPDEKGVRRAQRLDAGALKSGADKPDLAACLARGLK